MGRITCVSLSVFVSLGTWSPSGYKGYNSGKSEDLSLRGTNGIRVKQDKVPCLRVCPDTSIFFPARNSELKANEGLKPFVWTQVSGLRFLNILESLGFCKHGINQL